MKRTKEQFIEDINRYHTLKWHMTYDERTEYERKMFSDWYHEMEVGDHCHICHYSDVTPCTVVKKTASTLTVRYDKAERNPNWKPEWVVGGFSAVCTNIEDQQWIIEEDENGYTETFRWSKKFNQYRNTSGERLYPEWEKYYDYNF